jgi:DNA-binding beta-propeller fold protein YncE
MTSTRFAFVFLSILALPFSARAATIELVAGGTRDAVDVPATEALLREPFGTEFDRDGRAWIVEISSGNRLLHIDGAGVLRLKAGKPGRALTGDGGPALEAQFNGPHNLAILPDGDILIADTWNGRVRRVNPRTATVTSAKGWEVPVDVAKSQGPYCIALDPDGNRLYIANLVQVHVLDLAAGTSRVVAGNGKKGVPADGAAAVDAPLVDPRAVAADRNGNVYVLERSGHALRVVDKEGRIRTVVNGSGVKGSGGDGGPALEAPLNGPKHLCVDRDGTVLIADAENHLVRRYVPATGRIERVAGTGEKGAEGPVSKDLGGDPLKCRLNRPHGVTVHPQTGEIYITDSMNGRVLKITR